ncbi:hypothetical protein EDD27_4339 [Nonomuraea polychroma]|uniref:Uncharacterized protein n=1 Tax=Nonomuraea polychroma TaxID=46176 RepID=A0A438M7T8_9ACTN|nr:hypothetical protein [Nonomuraea polychroma]RVX41772.1 hypothetical protein EDD27_4339 [Nonomuraea polychroma]
MRRRHTTFDRDMAALSAQGVHRDSLPGRGRPAQVGGQLPDEDLGILKTFLHR